MKNQYAKPVVEKEAAIKLEKCFAKAMFSGDYDACPTCPNGVVAKDPTNDKCKQCMSIPVGDKTYYDYCQREGL